jgi:hypothetical protein
LLHAPRCNGGVCGENRGELPRRPVPAQNRIWGMMQ